MGANEVRHGRHSLYLVSESQTTIVDGPCRRATIDDLDALVALGERFVAYAPYGDAVRATAGGIAEGLRNVFAAPAGVVFVAERDGEIAGALVGLMTAPWCAPDTRVATELAWWVDERRRRSPAAVRLLRAFEAWARDHGAACVVMSDLVMCDGTTPAGPLFRRLGYQLVERAHIRQV